MTSAALEGVRVIELGGGIASSFAARLLGDLGADVVKVERPGRGDRTRRLGPLSSHAADPERSLLFQYLNWNKRSIAIDLADPGSHPVVRRLIGGAQVVIESLRPGRLSAWGLDAAALQATHPALVWTSVTAFGQTGPYAGFEGSDVVLQAMAGIMQISGRVDREPLKHGLTQAAFCSGMNAAYATLAALLAAEADGVGERVDVSMHECLVSEMVMNSPYYTYMGAVQGRRAVVQDPFAGEPIPAGQGFLAVQTGGAAPFERYADLFADETFRGERYATRTSRTEQASELRERIRRHIADRPAKEVFLAGSQLRLLLGAVQGADDLLRCEQLAARAAFVEVEHPATGAFRFPAPPMRLSATPATVRHRAPRLDEHRAQILGEAESSPSPVSPTVAPGSPWLPLAGVRVLDLSYVFAVPYMAGLLSDLGADVVKVEAPHRLDQTRRGVFTAYLDNEPGPDPWDRSGIFDVLNRGKRSIALDLGRGEGRDALRALVAKSDVVLENFTPRVMRKWNLHFEALKVLNPGLVMLSNTGYGFTGPWAEFPSQGTTLEATMGVTHYTGYEDDKPWKVGQSYPDFLACWTGLTALLAAVRHKRRTGEGQWIDLAMYQLGSAVIPQALLHFQLTGADLGRIGNADFEHAPSGVYPCRGADRWVAISVLDDARWSAFARCVGGALASESKFVAAEDRKAHRREIDPLIADWTRTRSAEEVVASLRPLGIACGPVMDSRDLHLDPHLRARGFFERVAHPAPVGDRPLIGRPYKFANRTLHIQSASPAFGADGSAVLREWAGFDDGSIEQLRSARVLVDRPTDAGRVEPLDLATGLALRTFAAVDPDYKRTLGLQDDSKA